VKGRLVAGVGINDADYVVCQVNPYKICPIYDRWKSMLWRCYKCVENGQDNSYTVTKVCDEWLRFSNFRKWLLPLYWDGCVIDKDLKGGGTTYSPSECLVLRKETNSFLVGSIHKWEGVLPRGVHLNSKQGKEYYVDISFRGKKQWLGSTDCLSVAACLWLEAKASQCDYYITLESSVENKKSLLSLKESLLERAIKIRRGEDVGKYF